MRLIGLAVVLAVSVLSTPLAAGAQQPGKVWRIGFLSAANPEFVVDAFRQGLLGAAPG